MPMKNRETVNLLVKLDGSTSIRGPGGQTYELTNNMGLVSLSIDLRLDAPDAFEAEFLATLEGQHTVYEYVKEGMQVEAGLGFETPVSPIFKGEIIYIDTDYDVESGHRVMIRGFDKNHRLTRGHDAKTWGDGFKQEQKMSGGLSSLFSGQGLQFKAPSKEPQHAYVPKTMGTDYDFMKWTGQTPFRKPDVTSNAVAQICFENLEGSNPVRVLNVRYGVSTFPAYQKVRVHGWDVKKKAAFMKEITKCSPEIDCAQANSSAGWTAGWTNAKDAVGKESVYEAVVNWTEHPEEAEKVGQAIFDSMSLKYLTGEVTCEGDPAIIPGKPVELKGFSGRMNGKVIVTQAVHRYSAQGRVPYLTTFQFASNAGKKAS